MSYVFKTVDYTPLSITIMEKEFRVLDRELHYLKKAASKRSLTRHEQYRIASLERRKNSSRKPDFLSH